MLSTLQSRGLAACGLLLGLGLLGGCATTRNDELTVMRSEADRALQASQHADQGVSSATSTANAASQKADQAGRKADQATQLASAANTKSDQALAEAKELNEKLDRMFKKSMEK
jgi:murein lipoprotein